MNVVIINPPNIWKFAYTARAQNRWPHSRPKGRYFRQKIYPTYPLLLTYAGAELEKEGFNVKIIDAAFKELSVEQIAEEALNFKPDLISLEVASNSFVVDMKTAKHLKQLLPSSHITAIGTHVTVFPEQILNEHPYLDTVIYGEFFITLRVLAECIRDNSTFADVKGLVYRDRNEVIKNSPRPWISSLDDLPFPARHLVPPEQYYLGHYTYKPQIMMMTSLGCPKQCIFCLWPQTIGGHKFRPRDPKNVANEVELVIREWNAKEIYFDDDTFNVTVKHAIGVCDELIKRRIKIPWITQARVDRMPLELLRKMKQAGCVKILFGVESGSQTILDNIKKGITFRNIIPLTSCAKRPGVQDNGAEILTTVIIGFTLAKIAPVAVKASNCLPITITLPELTVIY